MPRIARRVTPFCVHHVMFRFINGEDRFDQVIGAREEFLRRLSICLEKVDWILCAFALMSTHGHLSFLAGREPPSSLMKPLQSGFAGWWNTNMRKRGGCRGRTRGPVFADRFADVIVPFERVPIVHAYIHNNPVRAHLVPSPELSRDTSHGAFIAFEPPPKGLDVELALRLSGFDSSQQGRIDFHDFTLQRLNDPKDCSLSGEYATEKRRRIRAQLKLPAELSTGQSMENQIDFPLTEVSVHAQKDRFTGPAEQVIEKVAIRLNLLPNQLTSRCRKPPLPYARALAVKTWIGVGQRRGSRSSYNPS
jgi:hypothetical protein